MSKSIVASAVLCFYCVCVWLAKRVFVLCCRNIRCEDRAPAIHVQPDRSVHACMYRT